MKIKTDIIFSILLYLLSACQKEVGFPDNGDSSSTSYQTLGTYDSTGKPNYLLPKDNISSGMITYVKSTLPEKSDLTKTMPELLTNSTIADIMITQSSDVLITFAFQNTIYANALAFYTYSTNIPPTSITDIKSITYIFPNAGAGTPLRSGDKVKIGRFEPGTSIGFVLMKGAWNPTTKTLDNTVEHYLSTDSLNPEPDPKLKRHTVIINYNAENKTLYGFENTNRASDKCDHDFNDVVFYATVTP
jgi:hypothetical protein